MQSFRRILFLFCLLLSCTTFCGPATALAAGILFSLLIGNPFALESAVWSKRLLQLSVVGLGFGVSISDVWHAGREAVFYTPVSIIATVAIGVLLGRMIRTPVKASILISFGTAICGGSAIAAMAPVINAKDEEIAVSLATIFSLNAVALMIFPLLGNFFGLTEREFGLWAALAIHDTSSVVGAASAYGATALAVGTTVKLARAVWIAPAALIVSRFTQTKAKTGIPLFIIGFILAASIRSFAPNLTQAWNLLAFISRQGLVVTLFLVGNGLTLAVLRRVGIRPLGQGLILWILVSASVLTAILAGLVR
ncbi:MAG: putative sulfate exporter family transporter [Desulfuromonadaceae bacterium]|nr:putative sulfate exporter family transporter [Desulfuromonadaceae bacterium]MDD2855092.1 putative sulfate exporter family transporter [Desulfuromonadaceae bacterium]